MHLLCALLLPLLLAAFATVLHAVNAVAEIFYMSKKSGMAIRTAAFRNTGKVSSTKLDLEKIAAFADPAAATLTHGDPSAFFDVEAERWVLVWSSYPDEDSKTSASVFVAVSHEVDPLENWTVYSLEARPQITNGYLFCEGNSHMFSPMAPQVRCCCCCRKACIVAPKPCTAPGWQAGLTPSREHCT